MTKQIATEARPSGASSQRTAAPGIFRGIGVGVGAMLGTGIFVSIGIGAQIAGPAVLLGIGIAALVALCSGLSGVQLAAHAQSSAGSATGAFEYGSKYLNAQLGFTAAWMFICAKSASAATAALGIAGYVLSAFGITHEFWRVGFALLAVLVVVGVLTRTGLAWPRLANFSNLGMGSLAVLGLLVFSIGGLPNVLAHGLQTFDPFFLPASSGTSALRSVLHAAAFMFVAYAGFGRIAMIGDELVNSTRAVPRATIGAILVVCALYLAVGAVAVATVGAAELADITLETLAPLEVIAVGFALPGAAVVVAIGAIAAMLGILLNLIQALARLLLNMGRRKEMPNPVARTATTTHIPETAVMAVAILVSLLILLGDIRFTWGLSAFAILIYYAISNLAALQLPVAGRAAMRVVAGAGLLACLFLAFWLEPRIWITGLVVLVMGYGWRYIMRRL